MRENKIPKNTNQAFLLLLVLNLRTMHKRHSFFPCSYKIKDNAFPKVNREVLAAAFSDIESANCFTFVDATAADTDYVFIDPVLSGDCSAASGYNRNQGAHTIQINLQCRVLTM